MYIEAVAYTESKMEMDTFAERAAAFERTRTQMSQLASVEDGLDALRNRVNALRRTVQSACDHHNCRVIKTTGPYAEKLQVCLACGYTF